MGNPNPDNITTRDLRVGMVFTERWTESPGLWWVKSRGVLQGFFLDHGKWSFGSCANISDLRKNIPYVVVARNVRIPRLLRKSRPHWDTAGFAATFAYDDASKKFWPTILPKMEALWQELDNLHDIRSPRKKSLRTAKAKRPYKPSAEDHMFEMFFDRE